MPADAVDALFASIQSTVLNAMPGALAPVQDALQAAVGIPVERSGGKIIRSKPGEFPRKDKGRLQQEIIVTANEADGVVSGTVAIDVPYAHPLRDSGRKTGDDLLVKNLDDVLDQLAARITAEHS